MIQTSFVVEFLSSDIYERPVLIRLTVFPMTVHAGFILHRFIQNWLLHALAKDGVSVGCLLLFFYLSERFIGFAYDKSYGHLLGKYCEYQKCEKYKVFTRQ